MSGQPTAAAMVSEGVSRICDLAGVVLLIVLGLRMFFVFDAALETRALVVGLVGVVACWANRSALKNAPLPMLAYVGVALLSAAVHRWSTVSSAPEPAWISLFTPALHLVVMVVFIYGAAHLLRTPSRLSWFVVLLVAAIGVLAVQIAFDRASVDFVYLRGGFSLPSVPHWGGIHGTSLFLTIGFSLASAIMLTGPSVSRVLAGGLLAGGLLVVEYLNGSRGGLVSMAFVLAAMGVFAVVRRTGGTRRPLILGGGVVVVSIALALAIWSMRAYVEGGENLSGRTLIWEATARLALDHPWLGVGPGNYAQAIADSRRAEESLTIYGVGQPIRVGLIQGSAEESVTVYGVGQNAHNMVLHVAAEVGVIGALAFVGFMLWAVKACWRTWAFGHLPLVSLGFLFVLAGFLVHSLSENYLDARAEVERTRLLVWMVMAAALALERLPRRFPAEQA